VQATVTADVRKGRVVAAVKVAPTSKPAMIRESVAAAAGVVAGVAAEESVVVAAAKGVVV
jgi:hypothetical protein